jgi:hypothetical protein
VSVITAAGNDQLTISGSTLKDFNVESGAGDDTVQLRHIDAHGVLTVNLGDGNDTLHMNHLKTRRTGIDGGAGDNSFVDDGDNRFGTLIRSNFQHVQ